MVTEKKIPERTGQWRREWEKGWEKVGGGEEIEGKLVEGEEREEREGKIKKKDRSRYLQFNMRSPERFLEELSKVWSHRIGVADNREDFSEKT